MQSRTCTYLGALVVDRQPWVSLLLGKMKRTHSSGVPRTGFIISGSRVCWWKVLAELGRLFLIFFLADFQPFSSFITVFDRESGRSHLCKKETVTGAPTDEFKTLPFCIFPFQDGPGRSVHSLMWHLITSGWSDIAFFGGLNATASERGPQLRARSWRQLPAVTIVATSLSRTMGCDQSQKPCPPHGSERQRNTRPTAAFARTEMCRKATEFNFYGG